MRAGSFTDTSSTKSPLAEVGHLADQTAGVALDPALQAVHVLGLKASNVMLRN